MRGDGAGRCRRGDLDNQSELMRRAHDPLEGSLAASSNLDDMDWLTTSLAPVETLSMGWMLDLPGLAFNTTDAVDDTWQ